MKNPTLKIFAAVTLVILMFGGISVYMALQLRSLKKINAEQTTQIETLQTALDNCPNH